MDTWCVGKRLVHYLHVLHKIYISIVTDTHQPQEHHTNTGQDTPQLFVRNISVRLWFVFTWLNHTRNTDLSATQPDVMNRPFYHTQGCYTQTWWLYSHWSTLSCSWRLFVFYFMTWKIIMLHYHGAYYHYNNYYYNLLQDNYCGHNGMYMVSNHTQIHPCHSDDAWLVLRSPVC